MEYYRSAANAEYPCAQYNLACMYYRDKDYFNAVKYYAKAAEWGDGDAQKQITKMFTDEAYNRIATEFLAEEWPTYFSKLHQNCKNCLLAIYWILRNIELSENFPMELIGVIAKQIVLMWPKEDKHYQITAESCIK